MPTASQTSFKPLMSSPLGTSLRGLLRPRERDTIARRDPRLDGLALCTGGARAHAAPRDDLSILDHEGGLGGRPGPGAAPSGAGALREREGRGRDLSRALGADQPRAAGQRLIELDGIVARADLRQEGPVLGDARDREVAGSGLDVAAAQRIDPGPDHRDVVGVGAAGDVDWRRRAGLGFNGGGAVGARAAASGEREERQSDERREARLAHGGQARAWGARARLVALRVLTDLAEVEDHAGLVPDVLGVVAGRDRHRLAGADLGLLAVVHEDAHPTGEHVSEMRDLARISLRDRLDVLRPLPPGLEGPPPHLLAAELDDLYLTVSLERTGLVGGIEALGLNARHVSAPL